jgi:hypothetical protein
MVSNLVWFLSYRQNKLWSRRAKTWIYACIGITDTNIFILLLLGIGVNFYYTISEATYIFYFKIKNLYDYPLTSANQPICILDS